MDQKSGRSNATSALHGITQKIVTGPLLAQILAYSFFFWSLSARATRSLKGREQTRATDKRNEQKNNDSKYQRYGYIISIISNKQ